MYTVTDFKTKKEFKAAVTAFNSGSGGPVTLYSPGICEPKTDGTEYVEGPHFPKPHTWYAKVTMKDGNVIKVT